jgi:D-alanyl-D-alanine carboxypeptidase
MAVYSYNGWLASPNPAEFGGLDNRVVPGTTGVKLIPGLRAGDVAVVLFHVAAQLHARVEKGELYSPGDEWGYSYRQNRNANNLSCHSSGTAFDWNATRHPNGTTGTFTPAQIAEIRRILAEVDGVVGWGGDWGSGSTPDWMHFEIQAGAAAVKQVADKIRAGLVGAPIPEDDVNLTDRLPDLYTAKPDDSMTVGDSIAWAAAHSATARDAARQAVQQVSVLRADVAALANRIASGPTAGPAQITDADVARIAQAVVLLIGKKASS